MVTKDWEKKKIHDHLLVNLSKLPVFGLIWSGNAESVECKIFGRTERATLHLDSSPKSRVSVLNSLACIERD